MTYGSQLYMAAVGIVMLPFYVELLGVEAYGLVALLIGLQSGLALFDFGLSGTLMREGARYGAGVTSKQELREFLRFIEAVFVAMSICVVAILLLGAPLIAEHWLQNNAISDREAIGSLRLIGIILALRLLVIPYRALLNGIEDFGWLAVANTGVTTVRSVLILVPLMLHQPTLRIFFAWQIAVGVAELLIFAIRVYRKAVPGSGRLWPQFAAVRSHWRFSLTLALSAAIWVGVTNVDKVLLSGWLLLSQYALFSIAATAAGGVLLAVGPISVAAAPQLARIYAQGDQGEIAGFYGQFTQLTVCIASACALTLAFFPAETLWTWTGNRDLAREAALVMTLYALGNGLLAIGSLPFQLQLSAGRLHLHLIATALFLAIQCPLLWFATRQYGMAGAGLAWLTVNALFVLVWLPIAHRRFLPAAHMRWLIKDVLMILVPSVIVVALFREFLDFPSSRVVAVVQLGAVGAALLLVGYACSSRLRAKPAFALSPFRRADP